MLKKTEGNNPTIYWNPNVIIETTTRVMMSPTTVLNHELDHALGLDKALKDNKKMQEYIANRKKSCDNQCVTKEERRVITGSEQITARKYGEIQEGQVTRTDHYGNHFDAKSTISNEPSPDRLSESIIIYDKSTKETILKTSDK